MRSNSPTKIKTKRKLANALRRHIAAFHKDCQPQGLAESFLVQTLAESSWAARLMRAEATAIMSNLEPAPAAVSPYQLSAIAALGLCERRHTRLFQFTARQLAKLQAARRVETVPEPVESLTTLVAS